MQQRHIWKSRHLINMDFIYRLQSAWESSYKAFGKGRVFTIDGNYIETNLPWSSLRTFFRHAYVSICRSEWVTDTMTTDERFKEQE